MLDSLRKTILVSAAAIWLAGCGALVESSAQTVSGKAALDALAHGDYATAEAEAAQAVRQHPNDPYALIALALTYELTGRPLQARDYYKIVEALSPEGTIVLNDGIERRLIDVARTRLSALSPSVPAPRGPVPTGQQAWSDVMSRFLTLRRLAQAGLATDSEYAERRRANTGALLPYSDPPAALGLDQPPPSFDTVASRLQAISKALEDKAMTPRDHAMERIAILDALLPLNPRERVAGTPGLDPLVAPAYLGHLQKLRAADLIGADEAARERAAVERIAGPSGMPGMTIQTPPAPSATAPSPQKPTPTKPTTGKSTGKGKPPVGKANHGSAAPAAGGKHGIHLASYSSEAKAREGWDQLRRRFPDLAGLQPNIMRVDLGAKGVFFRLRAGPFASSQAAQGVCAKLKAGGQFCSTMTF